MDFALRTFYFSLFKSKIILSIPFYLPSLSLSWVVHLGRSQKEVGGETGKRSTCSMTGYQNLGGNQASVNLPHSLTDWSGKMNEREYCIGLLQLI